MGVFVMAPLPPLVIRNVYRFGTLSSPRVLLHADLWYYDPFRHPDTYRSHFPVAVIETVSSMRFLHRVSRASPVSTLFFSPLYKTEQSILWACIGFFFCFGLNVYMYQITKLEKCAGYSFEKLQRKERKRWRRVYVLVLAQYMLLFSWFTSP